MNAEPQKSTMDERLPALTLRRRSRQRKSVYRRPLRTMRLLLALGVVLLLGVGTVLAHTFLSAHYAVAWKGEPVIALATQEQCAQAIAKFKASYAPNAPEVVQFEAGELSVVRLKQGVRVSSVDAAVSALAGLKMKVAMDGYAIFVNSAPFILLPSKEAAVDALALMQQQALGNRDGIPTFDQRITVDHYRQEVGGNGKRPFLPIMTAPQAASELLHPPRPNYDTVGRGGSFYSVGQRHKLTVDQIKALNPTLDPQKLQPADKIRLPDTLAPVTISIKSS